MSETRHCAVCHADYSADEPECPYSYGMPESFDRNDIRFCRWRVHQPPSCENDRQLVERSRLIIARNTNVLSKWSGQLSTFVPSPIRIIAVLMIVGSVSVTLMSRTFPIAWAGLTVGFFIPVGLGLWFYQSWARWLAVVFYGAGLLLWIVSRIDQMRHGNMPNLAFPGMAVAITFYLLEWSVPERPGRPVD